MSAVYSDELKQLIVKLVEARVVQYVALGVSTITNSLKRDLVGAFQESYVDELNTHCSCNATDAAFEKLEKWCDSNNFPIENALLLVDRVYTARLSKNSAGQSAKPSDPSP